MGNQKRWMESYSPEKQKQLRRLHLLNALYDSKIILRYKYVNHKGEECIAATEFLTIPVFRNYLTSLPHQAKLIGYPVKEFANPPVVHQCTDMTVCVNWKEGNTRQERAFTDVYAFAAFLRANLDLAESLQFETNRPLRNR